MSKKPKKSKKSAKLNKKSAAGKAAKNTKKFKHAQKTAGRATKFKETIQETTVFTQGVALADIDASHTPGWKHGRKEAEALLAETGRQLSELQERLFADGRSGGSRSILLILQGMDTAGKGGIVRHVIGLVDPQGVQHASFGKPTAEELEHHFLWRIKNKTPRPGHIGVFDRSHYEDVLVARVNELAPLEEIEGRYDDILQFERELTESGTTIIKVLLHIDLDEQKARLSDRLSRPDKYWKYDPSDIDGRLKWPDYQEAFKIMLERTSTETAPWHIIPANNKWFARLAVSQLLLHALEDLNLEWPPPSFDVEEEKRRLAEA